VVSFMTRPLYPQRKNSRYPLERRVGEPQSRSRHGVEEKISQPRIMMMIMIMVMILVGGSDRSLLYCTTSKSE
jgi:hypothetical protein